MPKAFISHELMEIFHCQVSLAFNPFRGLYTLTFTAGERLADITLFLLPLLLFISSFDCAVMEVVVGVVERCCGILFGSNPFIDYYRVQWMNFIGKRRPWQWHCACPSSIEVGGRFLPISWWSVLRVRRVYPLPPLSNPARPCTRSLYTRKWAIVFGPLIDCVKWL